jgi:methylglutaconyl-CoA hydratase
MSEYDFNDNLTDAQALAGMLNALYSLPIPTIAVVRGAAFGGAVGLVACCDMALATDDAVFALSEVKLGLVPATIAPYVVRAIGERACSRLFLTGERFDARRAQELGLVSEVVLPAALAETERKLLDEILRNGPQAVRTAKRLLRAVAGQPLDHSLIDDTSQMIAEIRVSDEGQAGLSAFLNKQPPPWVLSSAE